MKKSNELQTTMLIVLLFICFLLTNCAPKSDGSGISAASPAITTKGECSGVPIVGKWVYNGDTLTINDDCTGGNITCGYEFKYPTSILEKPHTTLSIIKAKEINNCKRVGDNLINIELYNKGSVQEILYINDGFGEYYYMRAK